MCTFLEFYAHLEVIFNKIVSKCFLQVFKGFKLYIFKKLPFSWTSSSFSLPRHLKNLRANCLCISLRRTQTHMPRQASSARYTADGHSYSFTWIWRSRTFGDLYNFFFLMDPFLYRFSTFSEKMKIYWLKDWIFCKMHHRTSFFLALRFSVRWLRWKRWQDFELFTQQTHLYKIWLRSSSSVNSPSIF